MKAAQTSCATCEAERARASTARPIGEAISEAHKANACSFVFAHWPVHFRCLLDDCKKNLTDNRTRPAHEVPGMADACEAVAIGIHALET